MKGYEFELGNGCETIYSKQGIGDSISRNSTAKGRDGQDSVTDQ